MKRALDLSVRRQPESAPKAARTEPALSTTWDPGSVELLLGPHAQLKPLQKIAVNAALQGRDSFVLMPTGGGKSLCYTLPAMQSQNLVIVVSPLIALMQDQVSALRGKVPCAYLCSSQTEREREDIKGRLMGVSCSPNSSTGAPVYTAHPRTQDTLRMLYVTPESLNNVDFKERLIALYRKSYITLFAIDEAHCISSWGHQFRPAYRVLGNIRRQFPRVPIMALTATAKPEVQADIVAQLRLNSNSLERVISSFDRPNIHYSVLLPDVLPASPSNQQASGFITPEQACDAFEEGQQGPGISSSAHVSSGVGIGGFPKRQMDALRALLEEHVGQAGQKGCAIIYVRKKEDTDKLARCLQQLIPGSQLRVGCYHAGVPNKQRTQVNTDWKEQRLDVVVATVAFGMGLDRPNVRLVIHWNLPGSLEGYYQESGRAGRDGLPAHAVMCFTLQDRSALEWLVNKTRKEAEQKAAASAPAAAKGGIGLVGRSSATTQGEADSAQVVRSFSKVVEYAKGASCRRASLLAHFNETLRPGGCCNCDFCCSPESVRASLAALALTESKAAFQRAAIRTGGFGNGQSVWAGDGGCEFEQQGEGEGDEDQPGSEEEDYGQGTIVLEDVPRTAIERSHDQQDPRLVNAAARYAATAKKQVQQSNHGDSTMAFLERMEAAEARADSHKGRAGGAAGLLQLQPKANHQAPSAAASGVAQELRNSSVERLTQSLSRAPCAFGLDAAALKIVIVSIEGVLFKQAQGQRQAYSGLLSKTAAKFKSSPSVFTLPMQLLDGLQPPTSNTPASSNEQLTGQLRLCGSLLHAELHSCKQQAEALLLLLGNDAGGSGAGTAAAAAAGNGSSTPASAVTAPGAAALLARVQALQNLPFVPLDVLKMGVGRSAGDLKKACRPLTDSYPQVSGSAHELVETWRRHAQA